MFIQTMLQQGVLTKLPHLIFYVEFLGDLRSNPRIFLVRYFRGRGGLAPALRWKPLPGPVCTRHGVWTNRESERHGVTLSMRHSGISQTEVS